MKNILKIVSFLLLISTLSCNDDCGLVSSFPSPFRFELIDKATSENLFTNNTFKPEDIKVKDLNSQKYVKFYFEEGQDRNFIKVEGIGYATSIINYSFEIESISIFELYVDAERIRSDDDCNSYTHFNEISILNADFIEKGAYTQILVDLD